jgi:hypothetical protein
LIRFLLKLGIAFSLLSAFCIALIRAQPYDDSELRAFLTPPEGCPAPCFMGIRPGVTTWDEAQAILHSNSQVGEVNPGIFSPTYQEATFSWGEEERFLLDGNPVVRVFYGNIVAHDGIVHWLSIPTSIQVYEVLLWFGKPDQAYSVMSRGTSVTAHYIEASIGFGYWDYTGCRGTMRGFLHQGVNMHIADYIPSSYPVQTLGNLVKCEDTPLAG